MVAFQVSPNFFVCFVSFRFFLRFFDNNKLLEGKKKTKSSKLQARENGQRKVVRELDATARREIMFVLWFGLSCMVFA